MIHCAKSDSAVSPVIGTILLVAIAVVLVAIILVVVMGFSGDTNEKKVGLNAKPATGNDATLILYGGVSIPELIKLEMIDQGSPNGKYVELWNITNGTAFVGLPYLAEGVAQPLESLAVYDTRINVRGTFSDGTEVILLVQPMTFYDVAKSSNMPPGMSINAPELTSETKRTIVSMELFFTATGVDGESTGVLYYQEKGNVSSKQSVPATVSGSTDNPTYTVSLPDLLPETIYEVWGVITTPSGTYEGPSAEYETKTFATGYVTSGTTSVKDMGLRYTINGFSNLPAGTIGRIYYQERNDPSTLKWVEPAGKSADNTILYDATVPVYPHNSVEGNIYHDVWAVFVYKDKEYAKTAEIHDARASLVQTVFSSNYISKGSDSITGTYYSLVSRYPAGSTARIYYQVQGDSGTKESIDVTFTLTKTLIEGSSYELYPSEFTLTGLLPDTSYEITPVIVYQGREFSDGKKAIVKTLSA